MVIGYAALACATVLSAPSAWGVLGLGAGALVAIVVALVAVHRREDAAWCPLEALPQPPPTLTRVQHLVNLAGVFLVVAAYLAADPFSTHFHSTTTAHFLIAEQCITAGECPLVGPAISNSPFHLGPAFFYLLMPAAPFGYMSSWQVLLGIAALFTSVVLLVRCGDRVFGFPVGLISVPLWLGFSGTEFLVDLRHAPLAAPFIIAALFTLSSFWRAPSIRTWFGFCLLFWIGIQFQFSMYVVALPALWLVVRRARAGYRWVAVGVFAACGVVMLLPIWVHYSMGDLTLIPDAARMLSGVVHAEWGHHLQFLAPLVVVLILLEWRGRGRHGAKTDPVFSLSFAALMLVGYLPIIGMTHTRYLFPLVAMASVCFAVHLVRAARRFRSWTHRREAGLLASLLPYVLVAVAVWPHLVGAYFTRGSLASCDTLRGQSEIVDEIWARAAVHSTATPHVHGDISIEVSRQIEYLLHERAIRDGLQPQWSLDAPCVAIEVAGRRGFANEVRWSEYQSSLQYDAAGVELSGGEGVVTQRRGIRLPIGANNGFFLSKGQRTRGGAEITDLLAERLTDRSRHGPLELAVTIPLRPGARSRGALSSRNIRLIVDDCARIVVDGCRPDQGCSGDQIEVYEMAFGAHPLRTRVWRITMPGEAVLERGELRILLSLTECRGGLHLFDVYEVPRPSLSGDLSPGRDVLH